MAFLLLPLLLRASHLESLPSSFIILHVQMLSASPATKLITRVRCRNNAMPLFSVTHGNAGNCWHRSDFDLIHDSCKEGSRRGLAETHSEWGSGRGGRQRTLPRITSSGLHQLNQEAPLMLCNSAMAPFFAFVLVLGHRAGERASTARPQQYRLPPPAGRIALPGNRGAERMAIRQQLQRYSFGAAAAVV